MDVLDHGYVRLVDHMGGDLSIARAARVSYDAAWRAGEDEGSDAKLIRYLWKNHHTTPFEAVTLTFEVHAPIFVFRQWHRHRTWCLSGDTLISFELPCRLKKGIRTAKTMRLDELYRKWQPTERKTRANRQTNALWPRSRIQAMKLRVYDEENQQFTTSTIGDVIASGMKQVFEIELADGKLLKCSKDHQLLTTGGWQRLEDAVGLVVNNKTAGMTKRASVLTNGYVEGDTPWNKGVTGYRNNHVVTEAHKAIIREARSGSKSNFWKGGVTSERANIARWTREQGRKVHAKFDYTCQDCQQRGGQLHTHHIKAVVDYPDLGRDFENLITLCVSCHHKRHGRPDGEMRRGKGQTLRAMASEIVAVRLIGDEMTYDLSVDGEHHNFVANGMIVHNSFNELSARYRELPEEFYVPAPELIGTQSLSSKQARTTDGPQVDRTLELNLLKASCKMAFETYRALIAEGWPRELARSVLPVSTYSTMFATVNLLNLMKFLTLRTHEHAQWEIKVYADAMLEMAREVAPVAISAWEASQ
jgi:thymidylate synthase ThyX/5-methylcytosine-specific restriction endonuclease McrA